MKWLVTLLFCLSVVVPVYPTDATAAPVDDYSTVFEKPKKPKKNKHNNGKHKGHNKGKHNPHGNNPPPQHNPPGHNNNPPRNPDPRGNTSQQPNNGPRNNRPDPVGPRPRNNTPDRNRGSERPPVTRQNPTRCVRIVKPIETRVEKTIVYREVPKTRTEKVVYGAGLFAVAVVGAGLIMLFVGFVYGWFRRKHNEEEFMNNLLNDK